MLFYFLFQFQVIREHCRGKVPKVVAAAHHASVGACAADGEDVASLAVGQFAAFAPNVARLANRTDDIVKCSQRERLYDIVLNPPNPLFKGAITAFGLSIAARLPGPPAPAGHLMMPC